MLLFTSCAEYLVDFQPRLGLKVQRHAPECVLFKFEFSPNSTVHYCLTNNKHFTFPASSLPEQLHSQKEIVELMANYMEQNLMEVRGAVSPLRL